MYPALKALLGYKSQEQKDSEAADAFQKVFRAQSDAKIKLVKDEYERIKDNFLEKILEKMITYKETVDRCDELCQIDVCEKNKDNCDDIYSMISSKPKNEFVNLCKNVSDQNEKLNQSCSDANTQEFMIE